MSEKYGVVFFDILYATPLYFAFGNKLIKICLILTKMNYNSMNIYFSIFYQTCITYLKVLNLFFNNYTKISKFSLKLISECQHLKQTFRFRI